MISEYTKQKVVKQEEAKVKFLLRKEHLKTASKKGMKKIPVFFEKVGKVVSEVAVNVKTNINDVSARTSDNISSGINNAKNWLIKMDAEYHKNKVEKLELRIDKVKSYLQADSLDEEKKMPQTVLSYLDNRLNKLENAKENLEVKKNQTQEKTFWSTKEINELIQEEIRMGSQVNDARDISIDFEEKTIVVKGNDLTEKNLKILINALKESYKNKSKKRSLEEISHEITEVIYEGKNLDDKTNFVVENNGEKYNVEGNEATKVKLEKLFSELYIIQSQKVRKNPEKVEKTAKKMTGMKEKLSNFFNNKPIDDLNLEESKSHERGY